MFKNCIFIKLIFKQGSFGTGTKFYVNRTLKKDAIKIHEGTDILTQEINWFHDTDVDLYRDNLLKAQTLIRDHNKISQTKVRL